MGQSPSFLLFGENMKKLTVYQIVLCGIIAAIYAVLTILTSSFSYGQIQFRIAEALCVLCWFEPVLTLGLFSGCVIANLFSPVSALDIVVGSAATLIACLLIGKCKKPWMVPIPVIFVNAIIVGAELSLVYMPESMFWYGFGLMGAEVGVGELVVMYGLGLPLLLLLKKRKIMDRILKH